MRRTWLTGFIDVTKRYLIATAAHNLGRVLRTLFGVGKPRTMQRSEEGAEEAAADGFCVAWTSLVCEMRDHAEWSRWLRHGKGVALKMRGRAPVLAG
jgi:hypothetical protein